MAKIQNRGTIPQGMLAPSGFVQTNPNPNVQATTRPAGTLLQPSPGYDSIRVGKNAFQKGVPTGGFRRQDFAEDLGGNGAALSIVPGTTTAIEASEWLPENADSIPEGSIIIADRTHETGFAKFLHSAYNTIPDMGDRTPERPRSKAQWLVNPVGVFRADYKEHPATTVIATAGLVWLINIIARDVERNIRGYRPRGVGTAVSEPAAAVPSTAGDVSKQVADSTAEAVNKIGQATDEAVSKIGNAADDAVDTIKNATKE